MLGSGVKKSRWDLLIKATGGDGVWGGFKIWVGVNPSIDDGSGTGRGIGRSTGISSNQR